MIVHFFSKLFFQVFNSRSDDMIVNISTNTPVFHVQGLSSGTEYRVQIYSIQQGGRVSKHAAFETFTLQVCHTSFERNIRQNQWTCNATCLGLFRTCLGFIFYIMENKTSSLFEGPVVHRQKIPPNLGRIGCVCQQASPKRLDVLFSNM